jgi:flagellar hook-associated protein 2
MSSPITLSGFNNIDFNVVLNAIMQQERVPVTQLETQKKALEAQKSEFGTLASKLAALESAAEDLAAAQSLDATTATVSDTTRLTASSTGTAPEGTYEVLVQQLARAQVSTTTNTYADKDTTIVATGGKLVIGGKTVTVTGNVTLQQLADAINATADMPVAASVVKDVSGYRLMLTGRKTGAANAYTIDNSLTGANKPRLSTSQAATDARVTINGVTATSASNSFQGVVPGLDFTALKADAANTVVITITASTDSVQALVEKLVTAFNDISTYLTTQSSAAAHSDSNSIGRDPMVRGLRRTLASVLNSAYGGSYGALARVGLEFTRTGQLEFDATAFAAAMQSDKEGVRTLFRGSDGTGGAFGSLVSTIAQYTDAGGLVPSATSRLDAQVTSITKRIAEMEERLAIRRAALQREFAAADQAIAQLNSQANSLSQLSGQYKLY